MSLEMEDQKPFYIVVSSLSEVGLPTGCETPAGSPQVKSLSDQVTACAPDPKDLKKDCVPSHQTLEGQVEDTDRVHAGDEALSERFEDVSFCGQAPDGRFTELHEGGGEAGTGSWPVTEVVVGRVLEKVSSTQLKSSAQSQEGEDGAGTENSNCPRRCRTCCTGFGCSLLALVLVVCSPLVMIGYCLYEGYSCLYKCMESRPT